MNRKNLPAILATVVLSFLLSDLVIGLNLAGIAKIKVANYLLAIVFASFLCKAAELLPL